MIDHVESQTGSVEALVGQVADEFTDRIHRGEQPSIEEYAARHPEIAELLRQVLPALQVMGASGPDGDGSGDEPGAKPAAGHVLGDYRILREIGRGGMGIVYEAQQVSLKRRVALKVLPFAATLDPKRLQRFHNEAQAAAQLHHSGIVPVYAVGSERGVYYYAMQYIDGQTLAAAIDELRRPARPPENPAAAPAADTVSRHLAAITTEGSPRGKEFFRKAAQLGIQVSEALDYAHELGVVHRDVKPANLLLDARGNLWVTDFGLAQVAAEPGLTVTGDLVGTLRYMSPEQALAKRVPIDHRTDVYSLGVTLYELLTLRPAFDGADRQELLRQIAFAEPPPPRRVNSGIPVELETIVLKALEKSPADRYATARAFADDLRRYLLHEPIQARRPTLVHRARKVARRHPGVTVTVAVAMVVGSLLGVVGLVVNNWMVRQEQARTQAALKQAENEKAIAQAVRDFLRNRLLAQADPRVTTKPNPTVRQLLDRAAGELAPGLIDGQFPGQPLVQAEILKTIGDAYGAIGDYGPAAAHLERARDLLVRELDLEHPDTLATLDSLAKTYLDDQKLEKAMRLFERLRDVRTATFGPDHPETLASMSEVARCYFALKRHQEALRLRQEIVPLRKAKLGPDNPDTLESMFHLANSYAALKRYVDALQLHGETLALRKAKLGGDHYDTIQSLNNFANCHTVLDRHLEALPLHEETLALRRSRLGADHPDTLQSMNNVAFTFAALGRYGEAIKLYEETLAGRRAKLRRGHPHTIMSMNALAWLLATVPDQKLRNPAKATALAKQSVDLAPPEGDYWNTLGAAHYRAGDWKEAVAALNKSVQIRGGGDGTDWFFLAMAHWRLGQKEQARECFEKAVQWMEKKKPRDVELGRFRAEAAELLGVKHAPGPKPVPAAPPKEHGAGLSFDFIDGTARIAGDEPLVLAIDEQVEDFQNRGPDEGRVALRLNDGRENVVPAEEFDVCFCRRAARAAAIGVTDLPRIPRWKAQFLDHGARQHQSDRPRIDDAGNRSPSHLFLGQQATASEGHVIPIDYLKLDGDSSHAGASYESQHDTPPGADDKLMARL